VEPNSATEYQTARVDGQGRIVLPAAVRERFHWTPGSTVHLRIDDTGVVIRDRDAVIAEMRALFRPLRESGYTVDRFLAEKAQEAEEEERRSEGRGAAGR